MARFGDFNGMARLALFGSLAATLGFALPWVRLTLPGLGSSASLAAQDLTGLNLVVAPAVLQAFPTASPIANLLVAACSLIALVAALSSLILAVSPGLSSLRELNLEAGKKSAVAGLVTSLVALAATILWIGPSVGNMNVQYGGVLVPVGFALAAFAWPRALREGEDEDLNHEPAPPGHAPR